LRVVRGERESKRERRERESVRVALRIEGQNGSERSDKGGDKVCIECAETTEHREHDHREHREQSAQRIEDRGQRTEDRGQRTEGNVLSEDKPSNRGEESEKRVRSRREWKRASIGSRASHHTEEGEQVV
jgi:hypothetical protein